MRSAARFKLSRGGHDANGNYHEFNESIYSWTSEKGRTYKLQVFDDWANMIDFIAFMDEYRKLQASASRPQT
jgi:hypothetical protein